MYKSNDSNNNELSLVTTVIKVNQIKIIISFVYFFLHTSTINNGYGVFNFPNR